MTSLLQTFTVVAALCFFSAVTAEGQERQVRGKVRGQVELECSFPPSLPPDISSASLHVVEWVRQGLDIPVLIKFGSYLPRVHPQYEGRASLVRVTAMRLEDVRLEDQGLYECRILLLDKPTDELRNGTWTLLSVSAPPTFTEAPPPVVESLVGAHLTLTCVASGSPQPTITWIKDGSVIHQEGALALQALTTQSAGWYTCHASNSEGNATHVTRVKIKGPPVIVVPPKSISLNMSQNALLHCQAVADPPNMTYVWQKGGENVHHIDSLKTRVKIMVDGTLLISSLVPEDSGNYTCTPSNGLLTPPTASANLTVMHPAQALQMPQQTYLPAGMSGVVACRAAAQPPLLRVDWTKDGEPLDLLLYPGWSWTSDGSLFMATVNDDAAGVYTCTPYNSYGSMGSSGPTAVILQDPPSLSVAPQSQYRQQAGRTLLIPCQGNKDPTITINWSKVDVSRRVSFSVASDGSLLLMPVTKDHQGAWECSVTNRVASVKTSTRVFVLGTSPHPVSSLSVSPGVRQANVSWQPGFDGGAAQSFSVWVRKMSVTDDDDGDDDEEKQSWFSVPVPSSEGNRVQVTGLSPATDYQFSVLSHNKLGTGPFSEIRTTRTLDPPLRKSRPRPPAQLSADGDSAGLLLRWSPPEQQQHQRPPLTGFILQSRSEDGGWFDLVENISANSTELLVQGLQKDRVYELRLLSRSGELLSEPGPSVNVSSVGTQISAGSSRQLDFVPEPLLAGVLGGVGFMCLALVVLLGSACVINHKRNQRRRRRRRKEEEEEEECPAVIYKHSSSVKTSGPGSPDSVLKKSLLPANNLYPTTSSTTSSSSTSSTASSQTDCFSFSADDHLHHHHHRRKPPPSSCSKGRLSRMTSSPQIEMISRGPDGRFSVYDDNRKSVRYDRPPQVRRSVSLHSAGEDRKERPFVLSVDLPPCTPVGADSTTQQLLLFDQKQNYDAFPDLSSVCSNTSLATIPLLDRARTPTFPVLPHIKRGLGQTASTASVLVLQMEHERETGNLSRCLKLAQEREELEKELHRYTLEQCSERDMKRGQEDPLRHSPVHHGCVWDYKSRTLPHRRTQSIKKSIALSSSPLCSPSVKWDARLLVSPVARMSSPASASCAQSGIRRPRVEEVYGLTLPRFPSNHQRRERVEAESTVTEDMDTETLRQYSLSMSSFHKNTFTDTEASDSSLLRPRDGDLCAEMSVDDPEFEVFLTKPMLHHRIASHVQHGRSLTPQRQRHDMRRSQSLNCRNPASVDAVISASASPPRPEQELWRPRTTGSRFSDSKQRSRSLDSRRRKAENNFPTPDAWIESLSQENCSIVSSCPADKLFWNSQNFATTKIHKSSADCPSVAHAASRSPPPVDTVSSNSPEQPITHPDASFHYEPSGTTSVPSWPIIYHQQKAMKEAEGYLQEASRSPRPEINDQEVLEVEAGGYEGVPESGSSYSSYASSGRGSMEPANPRMSLCHLTLSSSPETVEKSQGRTQDTRRHRREPGHRRKASVDENYEWDAADVDSQPGNREGLLHKPLPHLPPPPPQYCDFPSMHCSTVTPSLHPGPQNIHSAKPEPDTVLF